MTAAIWNHATHYVCTKLPPFSGDSCRWFKGFGRSWQNPIKNMKANGRSTKDCYDYDGFTEVRAKAFCGFFELLAGAEAKRECRNCFHVAKIEYDFRESEQSADY